MGVGNGRVKDKIRKRNIDVAGAPLPAHQTCCAQRARLPKRRVVYGVPGVLHSAGSLAQLARYGRSLRVWLSTLGCPAGALLTDYLALCAGLARWPSRREVDGLPGLLHAAGSPDQQARGGQTIWDAVLE